MHLKMKQKFKRQHSEHDTIQMSYRHIFILIYAHIFLEFPVIFYEYEWKNLLYIKPILKRFTWQNIRCKTKKLFDLCTCCITNKILLKKIYNIFTITILLSIFESYIWNVKSAHKEA